MTIAEFDMFFICAAGSCDLEFILKCSKATFLMLKKKEIANAPRIRKGCRDFPLIDSKNLLVWNYTLVRNAKNVCRKHACLNFAVSSKQH